MLRLAAFCFLVAQIAPPALWVTLDAPQTVHTNNPQMCVHTRLIDEVPEYRMQLTFQAVREMGASTIVEFFPWAYVEGTRGVDDWQQADKIFRHARNQGVRVLARFGMVPQWARPDEPEHPTTFNTLPEEAYPLFADYIVRFIARYGDALDGVILWNEPNLTFEWGFEAVSAADYAKFLAAVSPVIRAAAPEMPILAGALAPTVSESAEALSDLIYLRQMLEAGAAPHFDVLAVHTYGFGQAADAPPAQDETNFRRVELIRDILTEFGLAEMPIAVTEFGWNDHPRWGQAVSPAERITYTLEAYEIARTQWPHVNQMCLWVFRYPAPTNSYPDGYTLVSTDFDYKPLYFALQEYTQAGLP